MADELTYDQAIEALASLPGVTQEMIDAIERVEAERTSLATRLANSEESRAWYRQRWHETTAAQMRLAKAIHARLTRASHSETVL